MPRETERLDPAVIIRRCIAELRALKSAWPEHLDTDWHGYVGDAHGALLMAEAAADLPARGRP